MATIQERMRELAPILRRTPRMHHNGIFVDELLMSGAKALDQQAQIIGLLTAEKDPILAAMIDALTLLEVDLEGKHLPEAERLRYAIITRTHSLEAREIEAGDLRRRIAKAHADNEDLFRQASEMRLTLSREIGRRRRNEEVLTEALQAIVEAGGPSAVIARQALDRIEPAPKPTEEEPTL